MHKRRANQNKTTKAKKIKRCKKKKKKKKKFVNTSTRSKFPFRHDPLLIGHVILFPGQISHTPDCSRLVNIRLAVIYPLIRYLPIRHLSMHCPVIHIFAGVTARVIEIPLVLLYSLSRSHIALPVIPRQIFRILIILLHLLIMLRIIRVESVGRRVRSW